MEGIELWNDHLQNLRSFGQSNRNNQKEEDELSLGEELDQRFQPMDADEQYLSVIIKSFEEFRLDPHYTRIVNQFLLQKKDFMMI